MREIGKTRLKLVKYFKSKAIVPTDKCSSFTGYSFGSKGWNHLKATLEEYDHNPGKPISETIFYKYHNLFTPRNASDIFSTEYLYEELSFDPPLGIHPWGSFRKGYGYDFTLPKRWEDSRFCGPTAVEKIKYFYSEFIKLYQKISKEGFNQSKYPAISGTILHKENGDYRYIVLQGNHRAAICGHIGIHQMVAKPLTGRFRIISENEVNQWYFVKKNKCSASDAIKYFNMYFKYNGLEQAQNHELV